MNKFLSLLVLFTYSAALAAPGTQSIPTDNLRIGKPQATDKIIQFDKGSGSLNPKLKWNNSSSLLQFSNDGTTFVALGGGSSGGSGKNYILNPDAEGGTTGWSTYNNTYAFATTDVNAATDIISVTGWTQGDGFPVQVSTSGTLPGGLSAVTTYYTTSTSSNTFKLAATLGGAAIDITSVGSGTHNLQPLRPITGTAGTPTVTWTQTSTNPLNDTKSFQLTSPGTGTAAGQGVSYDFSIDRADRGKNLQLQFNLSFVSGLWADTDLSVFVYDKTNAVAIYPAAVAITGANTAGTIVQVKTSFPASSSSTSYRMSLHFSGPSATASVYTFDNFLVGPSVPTTGAVVTDWVTFPVNTGCFGTTTVNVAQSRREGDSLHVRSYFVAGTPTGCGASFQIGYNGGLGNVTIDSTKASASGQVVGYGSTNSTASTTYFGNTRVLYTGAANTVAFASRTSTTTDSTGATGAAIATVGAVVTIDFTVPIVGWSSNLIMSSDAGSSGPISAKAFLTTSDQVVTNGSSPKITFNAVAHDTTGAFDTVNNRYIVGSAGIYSITGTMMLRQTTGIGEIAVYLNKNGSTIEAMYSSKQSATNISTGYPYAFTDQAKVGDYYEIVTSNNTGASFSIASSGAITGGSTFQVMKLGSGTNAIAASDPVAFRASATNTSLPTAANTNIVYNTKQIDTAGNYNTSTGFWTAPSAGKYQVSYSWSGTAGASVGAGVGFYLYLNKNGTSYGLCQVVQVTAGTALPVPICTDLITLAPGDTLNVGLHNTTGQTFTGDNASTNSWFSAVRVAN